MMQERSRYLISRIWNTIRMSTFLLALLVVPLIISGCSYTAAPADLLQKPAIDKDKEKLAESISKALPQYSVLMVPHRDDFKEAIRVIDLDSDGTEEAVVSYYNEYSTPEIMVMKQTEHGWKQSVLIEQPLARDIAWLRITDMDGDGKFEFLTGWIGGFDSPNVLEVYSYKTKASRNDKGRWTLSPNQSIPYYLADTGDLNGDKLTDLVVVAESGSNGKMNNPTFVLITYEWKNNELAKQMKLKLPEDVNYYDRMLIGGVSADHQGIVLEGNTGAHSTLTYMYTWERSGLRLVYPNVELGLDGFSATPTASADMNNDGIIELHWVKEPPTNEGVAYANTIWINQWMQWDGKQGFKKIAEQYLDHTYGVILDIPDSWIGHYSMRMSPASSYGIVTFDYWNEAEQLTAELVTMYVVPVKQWKAVEAVWKEEERPYRMLATASGNHYLVSFKEEIPSDLPNKWHAKYEEMGKEVTRLSSYLKIEQED
ncbi:VCBS repeat-containing protein [Paenibacillus sp. GSMTC-2017]|uniref:FG-GAP repeat domain-containing protein n=1 Tax=Paenibacillus sp. GSMTC-2017 TaxID=2794350 RepID=UPI0018D9AEBD|nr:VCBS repeat-containing protein [Paenibacillus sp. GSMTC-2017]MBH5319010.1 VCBS repeat-containing protein [Paenibacillus sp. GSMTC-2017]